MLELKYFMKLKRENKSDYLHKILLPKFKNDEKRKRNFLVFIYNAEDEDLVEFYDVILHPEKRSQYLDSQNEKFKKWYEEIKRINKEFIAAKTQMYESLDKNAANNILNNL